MLVSFKIIFLVFIFTLCQLYIVTFCQIAFAHKADQNAVVILSYFRIDEDYIPEENLDSIEFFSQMKELESKKYKILPLPTIIDSYKSGATLPKKAVAITFEGGYKSILNTALPYLLENKIPFTIFFNTEKAETNDADFLNWDELISLSRSNFVTLGVLPNSDTNLLLQKTEEQRAVLNMTKIAYRKNLQREPEYFSYPYGEYNSNLISLVKDHGYKAAFGLQNGVAYVGADLYTLPRFPIVGQHSNLDYFKTIINALPLPVSNLEPQNPMIGRETPAIGFTVDPELKDDIDALNCYVNGTEKAEIEKIGLSRIEIRLKSTFINQSQTRVNCTLPVLSNQDDDSISDQWRWIGFLFSKI